MKFEITGYVDSEEVKLAEKFLNWQGHEYCTHSGSGLEIRRKFISGVSIPVAFFFAGLVSWFERKNYLR